MIQHAPSAPDGSVTTLPTYRASTFRPTDVILCRLVAPLISFAFALLREDVVVRVLGRDIGEGLATLVKKQKATDITELIQKLEKSKTRELTKALASENFSLVGNIEDRYACLDLFVQASETVDEVLRRIAALFDDKLRGLLTLATVHKSKGLEWDRVFILDPELMPSRWAKQPWQQQQERNIQYVAVTRAKLDLIYIKSDCWEKGGAL